MTFPRRVVNPPVRSAGPAAEDRWIEVVIDGPPGPVSGRFIEVEDQNGHSVAIGQWKERTDGTWALRITHGSF